MVTPLLLIIYTVFIEAAISPFFKDLVDAESNARYLF